ncbi:MAG: hypothetical protein IKD08_03245 [Alphaproteobacteria bacterium]|nr:hypothetical protein [Alphaproteobacteria bacterium]
MIKHTSIAVLNNFRLYKRICGAMLVGFCAFFGAVSSASAFGFLVNHLTYKELDSAIPDMELVEVEREIQQHELDIQKSLMQQVSDSRKLRSSLGDTYITYEKDRLIETLKDFDTIMRAQMYFQTRNRKLLDIKENQNFRLFYESQNTNTPFSRQIEELQTAGLEKLEELNRELQAMAAKLPENVDYYGNKKEEEPKVTKEKLVSLYQSVLKRPVPELIKADANRYEVAEVFDVAPRYKKNFFIHVKEDERLKVTPERKATIDLYRLYMVKDAALRNYLFGMYVRTYLAERSNADGIDRYLYGDKIIVKSDDGGLNPWAVANEVWSGANKFVGDLLNSLWGVLGQNTESADGGKIAESSASNAAEKPIMSITNARQAISINTLLWVRADLEIASLIMLTASQLEMEVMLQTLSHNEKFWLNTDYDKIWGGTLSNEDKKWLMPLFDANNEVAP